jgi:molybdopterin-guanine dinucleotide biosynthesis protein A
MTPRVAGVILAGGRSTRMGGDEKAFLTLGDRPLLDHAIGRLRPQVGQIAINANGDPARFASRGLEVIADASDDRPGPLAGILAGLTWAAQRGCTHLASVPTDTPFIPADIVARLLAAIEDGKIALAASAGARHPVIGLWAVDLAGPLAAFLAQDTRRKVTVFADRFSPRSVDFPAIRLADGREVDPFLNINTPADVAIAEDALGALHG